MDIHTLISTRRSALGLSQTELATQIAKLEQLKKPLAWQTIQQWENKKSAPKRARMPFVASALQIPLDWLQRPETVTAAQLARTSPVQAVSEAPTAQEPGAPYKAAPAWPFLHVTPSMLRLSPTRLAALERTMLEFLGHQSPVPDWRTLALNEAAVLDQKNGDEDYTTFVRIIDHRAAAIAAKWQSQEERS